MNDPAWYSVLPSLVAIVPASMASATDHIDRVRTQLPYPPFAAGVATAGFLIAGIAG